MTDLTSRQEQFCVEYAIDSNAVQAAIRAGYTESNSKSNGYKLLQNPLIKERLAENNADSTIKRANCAALPVTNSNLLLVTEASKRLGEQEKRILLGVYGNKGMLTHRILSELFCNNAHKVYTEINNKIFLFGMQLIKVPQAVANSRRNCYHWYLVTTTHIEYFDTDVMAANDEVIK
tara:strand:- start:1713 stop:2243 length:531 start_codon:yes stop_codon:yes gene_type:complete